MNTKINCGHWSMSTCIGLWLFQAKNGVILGPFLQLPGLNTQKLKIFSWISPWKRKYFHKYFREWILYPGTIDSWKNNSWKNSCYEYNTCEFPIASTNLCNACLFRIAIAYCNLEFQAIQPGTPKTSYVFHMGTSCTRMYIICSVLKGNVA